MAYLKRSQAPKFWPIKRKGIKFTVKSSPGPHALHGSMPLMIIVRDILKFADNSREAKTIIKQGKILVDKAPRKEHNFPVGLMDAIEIPDAKKYMRIVAGEKGLKLIDIDQAEASKKICRIQNKMIVKNGLTQLNLHDGRNILTEAKGYSTGDSLLIQLPGQNILEHYNMAEGSPAVIIGGKNMGTEGRIAKIFERKTLLETRKAIIETDGNNKIETLRDYIIVTGSRKAENPSTSPEEPDKQQKKPKAAPKK